MSFISEVSKVATMLVVGHPMTKDLSAGTVVSDTSSKQVSDNQTSQIRMRFFSLNVVLDLQGTPFHKSIPTEMVVIIDLNAAVIFLNVCLTVSEEVSKILTFVWLRVKCR